MMADQLKNLMIGIFVTAAGIIIVFIILFLHPHVGDEGKLIHVLFTDIDKVTIGTRVTYAGRPVGEVVGIKEVEFGREGRADSSGHIYLYELTLRVDSGVTIYNTDTVSLRTSGLLGEKNVEITPMAPEPGQDLRKISKEPIYAEETGTVENTFKEFKQVADKMDKALDVVTDVITRVRDQQLVEKITHTVENIQSITASLDHPREWRETLSNIHKLSARALHTWDHVDTTLESIHIAAINANKLMEQGHAVTLKINQGEGTLGKLIQDEDLYLRTNSILSKLETALDDINHYGLMFHSDKGWQRLRARRLNLLQQLRTPQEFRNYFNDEIDQINTSISRVYTVLNEIGCDPYCGSIMENCEFKKVFAELMRRVAMLEEEVRMYNTQLVETKVHETELGNPPLCETPCNYCQ